MKRHRNLVLAFGEWLEERATNRMESETISSNRSQSRWLPTPGTVLFVVFALAALLWGQSVGAFPLGDSSANSTGTIAYQGRLADANGNPLTNTLNMSFRLYSAATGGTPLWAEQWTGPNGAQVSDGLFNVMLGSLTPIPQSVIAGNSNLFLGITVGTDDEMAPRVQLGSVPFAVQALTVPDGSITLAKLSPDVSLDPPDASITTAKLADSAVTTAKTNIVDGLRVGGVLTATGDINLGGVIRGATSQWADYRSYIRFMKQAGATDAGLCPEGGVAVGVTSPFESLNLKTGNDIAAKLYNGPGTCVNVHQIAPCGTIIGDNYPYTAESCTTDFTGKWAPFYWWNGESTHTVTTEILSGGIGCFPVKYACIRR
ncbi:MAG: hypothetical protein WAU10_09840 [Caldilineaceae bacterium]